MIIEIDEAIFNQLKKLMRNRNTSIYKYLETIQPLQDIQQIDTLTKARETKTNRIKENIKQSLIELLQENKQPSKYKVHKKTNIAYNTLKKYYDEILKEVQNEY